MDTEKTTFRHESLQSIKGLQEILKSITKGLAKGVLSFSDEEGEIHLTPKGLLNLKVTVRKEDSHHRLDIRISWQDARPQSKKQLQVGHDRK
ncbi:amphi-Trp domain-containing protein [Onishia taeanensis]|uniref:Amphi-Trp domain-containing protein n=1 Tax=Onishia taeanensis TaxID=284577 RepID=A0A328XU17_9GAMM|nr:amphi-Trp domain-containing protein [Halomonas taeanensis]RAR61460.1 amphi-Trp domain-containing protein [Halomonas taeanensis]